LCALRDATKVNSVFDDQGSSKSSASGYPNSPTWSFREGASFDPAIAVWFGDTGGD